MGKKRLIIFDGNALIHRAYHALPPLTNKKGELINAVYGFLLVFLRVLRELSPEFIVATFDFPALSFRHKKYALYKATRKKAPDELYQQIPGTKEILEELGVFVLEKEGYEADDIIATIARKISRDKEPGDIETVIVSGDLDTLQLVDKKTKVYALRKGVKDIVLYDEKGVQEKYGGLRPEQLVDFKALRGDPSDNIPGVFGVGEKTAISLIKDFGAIENLYRLLAQNKLPETVNEKLADKLRQSKEKAFLSKELAELEYSVPIDFDLEKCRGPLLHNKEKIAAILMGRGFNNLARRFLDDKEQEKKKKSVKLRVERKDAGKTKKTLPAKQKEAETEQSRVNLQLW